MLRYHCYKFLFNSLAIHETKNIHKITIKHFTINTIINTIDNYWYSRKENFQSNILNSFTILKLYSLFQHNFSICKQFRDKSKLNPLILELSLLILDHLWLDWCWQQYGNGKVHLIAMDCFDELHEGLADGASIQYVQVLLIFFFLVGKVLDLTVESRNILFI